ncbi:MAG: hypothetical protein ABIT04_00310 [Novosphingobium sp.]
MRLNDKMAIVPGGAGGIGDRACADEAKVCVIDLKLRDGQCRA